MELKVVDDEGKTVPFGNPGELLVRGYSTMMGYWGEPEKTRKTLGEDGWLHTGYVPTCELFDKIFIMLYLIYDKMN